MSELVEVKNDNPLGFILAGKCLFTVQNTGTGNRFTFRVRSPKVQRDPSRTAHFVDVLSGPENTRDYTFLGTLFAGTEYSHSRKSVFPAECPSEAAFVWLIARLLTGSLPEAVKLYHHGKCGRCGRTLTVPSSIQLGLGPECAQHTQDPDPALSS